MVTALFIPLVWSFVPESVDYLAKKWPESALQRINQTLARMGHAALSRLPKLDAGHARHSLAALFTPGLAAGVLVWANVGGALGGALFGLLTLRFGLMLLTLSALFLSAIMVAAFGRGPDNLGQLAMMAGSAGFRHAGLFLGAPAVVQALFQAGAAVDAAAQLDGANFLDLASIKFVATKQARNTGE